MQQLKTRKPSGILSRAPLSVGGGMGGAPQKVGQSSPKFFRGCYPLRPPIVPNFIEIGQTSLEIEVGGKKISTHRQTNTHTAPDWLSRTSQHARGATKNVKSNVF